MKISPKQKTDIETCKYFIPQEWRGIEITDKDVEDFLAWSERGECKRERLDRCPKDGFQVLELGKSRRGLHMQMWEEGVMEGSVPYATLLEGTPQVVVDFMAREMFKGLDRELIYGNTATKKEKTHK